MTVTSMFSRIASIAVKKMQMEVSIPKIVNFLNLDDLIIWQKLDAPKAENESLASISRNISFNDHLRDSRT